MAEFLYALKLANHETVAEIETEPMDGGHERYSCRYLWCLVLQLRGLGIYVGYWWWMTHINRKKYVGFLLTASGQDANFQVFPLAFAVVDSENEEAW